VFVVPAAAAEAASEPAGAAADVLPSLPPQLAISAATRMAVAGPIVVGPFLEVFISVFPSIQQSFSSVKSLHQRTLILVNGLLAVGAVANSRSDG
jgi:hypothetical protein